MSLSKSDPSAASSLNQPVAIFFCMGACFVYRRFILVDLEQNDPRYGVKCERCNWTIRGSYCTSRMYNDVEIERTYQGPMIEPDNFKIAADRLANEGDWLGRSEAPPGALLIGRRQS